MNETPKIPSGRPPRRENLTGRKFNNLTALRYIKNSPNGTAVWLWKCECGNEYEADAWSVKRGATKGCGCVRGERHKAFNSKEYHTWETMKGRCTRPNLRSYRYYGARGIRVCERWMNSFSAFMEDMGPKPTPKHTIDRINNDGNYEPGNCRWATMSEQNKNKRKYGTAGVNGNG